MNLENLGSEIRENDFKNSHGDLQKGLQNRDKIFMKDDEKMEMK